MGGSTTAGRWVPTPARLGTQDERPAPALVQARPGEAAIQREIRLPSTSHLRLLTRRFKPSVSFSCKLLLLPSSSPSPSHAVGAGNGSALLRLCCRTPTGCSGLLCLRQRAPQVRRTLGSLNLVASPPGARRRRACRRNRTIFYPLLLLLRREVEGGRGNNDISPRPADWTPTCHACVACHMRKCGKIIS